MKRAKLIIPRRVDGGHFLMSHMAKLVDADTGEEIECVSDIQLNMPLQDAMSVTATILISDIELRDVSVPIEHTCPTCKHVEAKFT